MLKSSFKVALGCAALGLGLVAVALASVVASVAIAAITPATAADGVIHLSEVFAVFRPYVTELAALLVAGLVAWLSRKASAVLGLTIEKRHRDALQSALNSAAALVIDRAGDALTGRTFGAGHPAMVHGVEYVLRSVPDAAAFFGLTDKDIGRLIEPKLAGVPRALIGEAVAPLPAADLAGDFARALAAELDRRPGLALTGTGGAGAGPFIAKRA